MNELIQFLSTLDPWWIYTIIFLVAFIENIFPPAPSDVLVVFGGALAAMGKGHFFIALLAGATGGTLGFMVMYGIGKWFGHKILETGKIKFIKLDELHKFERWFASYGYWLIIANRFLTGTRAVVSFFAGMSELDFTKTSVLSFLSSMVWYTILVYAGYSLGKNWERVGYYLKTYSIVISILVIGIVLILVVRYLYKRHQLKKKNNG